MQMDPLRFCRTFLLTVASTRKLCRLRDHAVRRLRTLNAIPSLCSATNPDVARKASLAKAPATMPFQEHCDEEHRQEPERQRWLLLIKLELEDGGSFEAVIRNVSRRGLGCSSREFAPLAGVRVRWVPGDGEEYAGIVRWVEGRNFGIAFAQDLLATIRPGRYRVAGHGAHVTGWTVTTLHKVIDRPLSPAMKKLI